MTSLQEKLANAKKDAVEQSTLTEEEQDKLDKALAEQRKEDDNFNENQAILSRPPIAEEAEEKPEVQEIIEESGLGSLPNDDPLKDDEDVIREKEIFPEQTPQEMTLVEAYAKLSPTYEAYEPPKGAYKALRLKQILTGHSKDTIRPNKFGYYEPKDEKERKLLEYYDKQDKGLVELVK